MPNQDGSGPNGMGSRTGRGLGNCDTKESDDTLDKQIQPQRRFFRRNGRGFRNRRR